MLRTNMDSTPSPPSPSCPYIPGALQGSNHLLPINALCHTAHANGAVLSPLGGGGVHRERVVLHLVVHVPEEFEWGWGLKGMASPLLGRNPPDVLGSTQDSQTVAGTALVVRIVPTSELACHLWRQPWHTHYTVVTMVK